ncbi:PREDICTED: uncharacterized protein LOC108568830 [Nicrophorus vespilloides]|uniref:Uncharacterized protein LOC108568830 n=1 Tax=Nicrophorus vespilloides TaxID=110193 RepID=A0ABM1NFM0_NICVS|nr:PREDICTED: uncharacterized protein LOC108568830 [Nicrophorus vespilloides]
MNKLWICFAIVCVLVASSEAASQDCPLASKMTSCSPKCKDDTECFGRRCCTNICNTKSCAAENQLGASASSGYKGSGGSATGNYCGNVKCSAYETCKFDSSTKRQKCMRT